MKTKNSDAEDARRYRALHSNIFHFKVAIRGMSTNWTWEHHAVTSLDDMIDKIMKEESYNLPRR